MATTGKLLGNAATAAGRALVAAAQGELLVPPGLRQRRLGLCQACPYRAGDRCTKCGCFVSVKTRLQTEACPVGKW